VAAEDYNDEFEAEERYDDGEDGEAFEPQHDALSEQEQKRLEEGQRLASIYLQSSNELLDCAKLEPDWLVPNAVPASAVSFAVGKPGCLAGDTMIQVNRGSASRKSTLRDLHDKQNGVARADLVGRPWRTDVVTRVPRAVGGVVQLADLAAVWESGVKELYELTTDSGRTIKATADHPFLRFGGAYVPLGSLRVGDYVAVNVGLETLTKYEHAKTHALMQETYDCLQRIGYERIVSIKTVGSAMTYDLEVVGDPHNFLANDFVVHNSAKSWLAYDLALAVVQQRDWLGFGVPTAGLHPSAMILNFDNPHPECARRFLRLGLTRQDRLWVHSFGAHNPPEPLPAVLQLPDAYAPLESMVYALRPAVIIVDSLRQAHTGDESSSQEMARVMGQLKRMAMWGAAIVIVHHSRKNDGAMRGSTEIEATADSILDVEREADVSLVSWRKTRGWEMAEPTLSVSVVDEGDRTYVRGGLSVSALLSTQGPLTRSSIGAALRLNQAQAKKLIDKGVERGVLVEKRSSDGGRTIELAPRRGE